MVGNDELAVAARHNGKFEEAERISSPPSVADSLKAAGESDISVSVPG